MMFRPMAYTKFLSIWMTMVLLNPLCCCQADFVGQEDASRSSASPCAESHCAKSSPSSPKPCEGKTDCPVRDEWLQIQGQTHDYKSSLPGAMGQPVHNPISPDCRVASSESVSWSGRNGQCPPGLAGSLRLHQVNCVYLI